MGEYGLLWLCHYLLLSFCFPCLLIVLRKKTPNEEWLGEFIPSWGLLVLFCVFLVEIASFSGGPV